MTTFKHTKTGRVKTVPGDHPVHGRMVESPLWERVGRSKAKAEKPASAEKPAPAEGNGSD